MGFAQESRHQRKTYTSFKSFGRKNSYSDKGWPQIRQRNHEDRRSQYPDSDIVSQSKTCSYGKACDNQSEVGWRIK